MDLIKIFFLSLSLCLLFDPLFSNCPVIFIFSSLFYMIIFIVIIISYTTEQIFGIYHLKKQTIHSALHNNIVCVNEKL